VLKGCVHCVSVSVCVIWLVGTGVFFFAFPCDVWSVCSHEVRLEEKGVVGDEMRRGDGQDIIERVILILGSWFFTRLIST